MLKWRSSKLFNKNNFDISGHLEIATYSKPLVCGFAFGDPLKKVGLYTTPYFAVMPCALCAVIAAAGVNGSCHL